MPNSPAKTDKKQGSQFKPGQSGNPNGRPNGSRNKATLALEALLDDEGEGHYQKGYRKGSGGRYDGNSAMYGAFGSSSERQSSIVFSTRNKMC